MSGVRDDLSYNSDEEASPRGYESNTEQDSTEETTLSSLMAENVSTDYKWDVISSKLLQISDAMAFNNAVSYDNTEAVREMLARGFNPRLQYTLTPPLLHMAAENNNVEIINMLLDHGVILNVVYEREGFTEVHYAVKANALDALAILLKRGSNPNGSTLSIMSPLMLAITLRNDCANRLLDLAEIDVDKPFKLQAVEDSDSDSGDDGSENEHAPKVEPALMTALVSLNMAFTPLMMAIYTWQPDIVRRLIDKGANVKSDMAGMQILFLVIASLYADEYSKRFPDVSVEEKNNIIDLLIAHGAEINTSSKGIKELGIAEGVTPLMLAVSYNQLALASRLAIQETINAFAPETGEFALQQAIIKGYFDIADMLLARGADINLAPRHFTLLFAVAQEGKLDAVRYLLAHGADTSIALSRTPAEFRTFAVKRGVEEPMNVFLQQKDPGSTLSTIAMTPADIAKIMGHDDIAALLQQPEKKAASTVSVGVVGNFGASARMAAQSKQKVVEDVSLESDDKSRFINS